MNHNVNYGLWVIMMCHLKFTNYNKCTTLVEDVDNRGSYVRVETRGIWEIFASFLEFFCQPKTALKKSLYKKK